MRKGREGGKMWIKVGHMQLVGNLQFMSPQVHSISIPIT